jgi:hypothetical protein
VSKPIPDNSHINSCGNQLDSNTVAKRMWTDAFFRERWYLSGRGLNILLEFESYTCRTERAAIAIHEDWVIVSAGLAPQQML